MPWSRCGVVGALTGIAAAFAHVRRLTRDQALAELRAELAAVPAQQRQRALDEAARFRAARATGGLGGLGEQR